MKHDEKAETAEKKAIASKTPAYIIGDKNRGITIVVTNPVMVVHYSPEDLEDPQVSDIAGAIIKISANQKDPGYVFGAIVQHLVPHLRGVEVPELFAAYNDYMTKGGTWSAGEMRELKAVFDEMAYARILGQMVRQSRTICDVDFCIALDIDPCEVAARGRWASPSEDIGQYLQNYADCDTTPPPTIPRTPQKFPIGELPTDNLDPRAPWKKP